MSTRRPWPTARRPVPIAAVVFPLPGPVLTMMSPRRMSVIGGRTSIVPAGRWPRAAKRGRNRSSEAPRREDGRRGDQGGGGFWSRELLRSRMRMHLKYGSPYGGCRPEVSPHETKQFCAVGCAPCGLAGSTSQSHPSSEQRSRSARGRGGARDRGSGAAVEGGRDSPGRGIFGADAGGGLRRDQSSGAGDRQSGDGGRAQDGPAAI